MKIPSKGGESNLYRNVIRGTGLPRDQYLSRDQMIAYCIFSKEEDLNVHFDIFNHLKRKFCTYDNVTGKVNFKRIVMPWDYIFIGILCNDKLCLRLINVLYLKLMDTYRRGGNTETSGELLGFIQMECLGRIGAPGVEKQRKKHNQLMDERFGAPGFAKAFGIYFPDPEHPLHIGLL
jgi:hypothetical protein